MTKYTVQFQKHRDGSIRSYEYVEADYYRETGSYTEFYIKTQINGQAAAKATASYPTNDIASIKETSP